MSEKHENPYQRGDYRVIFAGIKKAQITTRSAVVLAGVKVGKTEQAANGTANVLLSPREKSERGDCRGNISAMGHLYYIELLPRKEVDGVKEEQKLRLRWRKTHLAKKTRNEQVSSVASEKIEKTATESKSVVTA